MAIARLPDGKFQLDLTWEEWDALFSICSPEHLVPRVTKNPRQSYSLLIDENPDITNVPAAQFKGLKGNRFNPGPLLRKAIYWGIASGLVSVFFLATDSPRWLWDLWLVLSIGMYGYKNYLCWKAWREHVANRDLELRKELAIRFLYQLIFGECSTFNLNSALQNQHLANQFDNKLGLLRTRYEALRRAAPEQLLTEHDSFFAVDGVPAGATVN